MIKDSWNPRLPLALLLLNLSSYDFTWSLLAHDAKLQTYNPTPKTHLKILHIKHKLIKVHRCDQTLTLILLFSQQVTFSHLFGLDLLSDLVTFESCLYFGCCRGNLRVVKVNIYFLFQVSLAIRLLGSVILVLSGMKDN